MWKAVVAVLALLAGGTAVRAQPVPQAQPAQPPTPTAWADNLFKQKPLVHDFGSVPLGAQLYHRFEMENIYSVPLEIIATRVSCGCVTVTPSVRVLEPKAKASLDITMDAHRFTGHKTVTIYMTVGPQYVSTATLQVSAYSRADVVFNPGQVSFGAVARGSGARQSIDVEYAGVLDWRVSEVVKSTAPLDVTFSELYRRPGQVGYRVVVAVKPDAPPGAIKEELLLRTNDPASPLVPVLVEALVQAPLAVVPGTVNFGSVKVGQVTNRRVMVRGSKPFRVVSIEGLGDGVQATLPPTPAPTQFVTLQCQPTKPGELSRQLVIRTDLDQEPPVTVTVEGTAEP